LFQTREELEHEVVTQYRTLGRTLKATSGTVWMEIDLTIAQLRTLLVLAEEGPLVIGQIAQRLGIGLSTGGRLVDRLVQAGLAERTEDAEDRRRTLARLTSKGEDLYARLLNHPLQMQTLIQKLDDADLQPFCKGCKRSISL
jgi:MarR family transcriptional regulator, organic hydroperoxide resistance regulator